MRIYYDPANGRIVAAMPDAMLQYADVTQQSSLVIDESDANAALLRSLRSHLGRVDAAGLARYYMVDNAGTWELHERDGWVEAPPEEF